MRTVLPLPAAVLAAALLLSACGSDAGNAAEDPSGAPTTAEPTEAAPLADGGHFGFLTAVDAASATIGFDEAVWVNSDDEPDGYRIENPDPTVVTLPVADAAVIEILQATGDPSTATEVDVPGLQDWAEGPAAGQDLAFDLEITGGAVTTLRFRYRP